MGQQLSGLQKQGQLETCCAGLPPPAYVCCPGCQQAEPQVGQRLYSAVVGGKQVEMGEAEKHLYLAAVGWCQRGQAQTGEVEQHLHLAAVGLC